MGSAPGEGQSLGPRTGCPWERPCRALESRASRQLSRGVPRENAGEHPPRDRRFLGDTSKLAASKEILLKRRRAMAVLGVPGYGDLLLRSDVRQGNTLATRWELASKLTYVS